MHLIDDFKIFNTCLKIYRERVRERERKREKERERKRERQREQRENNTAKEGT